MKKIILLALLMVTLIGLYSCNNNNSNTNNDSLSNNTNNTEAPKEDDAIINDGDDENFVSEDDDVFMIEAGKKIPNFKMKTLSGDFIEPQQFEGKIVMLNFWATWCTYCDQEMPDLNIIDKAEDVVVIAINAQEKQSVIQEYIDDGGYEFLTVLDEDGLFSNLFGISSLPVTFFINEEGILIGAMPTMMTLEQMEQIVQDIRDDIL
jgi:thiol-disulfide isomerase/thioredoxin